MNILETSDRFDARENLTARNASDLSR